MMENSRQFTFSVDMPGLINLMGTALYSEPEVAFRELIQNAHDGIVRRKLKDLSYQGAVHLHFDSETDLLSIEDDGIGLSFEDAEKYLGTLGTGITGLMRREAGQAGRASEMDLIGQFGIGLLSAFLLSDEIVVESLKADGQSEPIRWSADNSTVIKLSKGSKASPGTKVILRLRSEHRKYLQSEEILEEAVRKYADYLNVPIFLNDHPQRINLMNPVWFDPEADEDDLLLALEERFHELPLCVIPVRKEKPVTVQGVLYVSPQRLPGFTSESMVSVTVHRMIISNKIQGLIPAWATFVRGVLELTDCHPTASREDLVRDRNFEQARQIIEEELFRYFESLVKERPAVWESLLNWHRYMIAGAAAESVRLRSLLLSTYRFSTQRGRLTFIETVKASAGPKDPEEDLDKIIWYHCDRRQESSIESVFAGLRVPCVHATKTFEETLLNLMASDYRLKHDIRIECRAAVPDAKGFSAEILGAGNQCPIDEHWDLFFESLGCRVYTAECLSKQPVFVFLNERQDLVQTINTLKQAGTIPVSFQRMIDAHLGNELPPQNEILLNRSHPLIAKVLTQSPSSPLAAVVRLLVFQAMQAAGGQLDRQSREELSGDLMTIANALDAKK